MGNDLDIKKYIEMLEHLSMRGKREVCHLIEFIAYLEERSGDNELSDVRQRSSR